ncbi:MAG: helix-turn-helix domain-containing protein [Nocardioides sp.]
MVDWTNASATAPAPTATRAGVLRPDQLAAHVRLDRAPAAPEVATWVENHWSLEWDLPAGAAYLSSTLPHPACNLTVERGAGRAEVGDDPVVVTGVPTRRFDVTILGRGWVHGVKFRPGGLAALTGIHARELRNRTVPASEVLPERAVATLRTLGPGIPPDECRATFDAALGALAGPADADYDAVLEVVAAMLADRSMVRVAQVESVSGFGTRSLQRLFARYVGVSPKWVLARYRMHDVVGALDDGYAGSLADLAAEHGWFDQAHFTREFTTLVGVPPGEYRRHV